MLPSRTFRRWATPFVVALLPILFPADPAAQNTGPLKTDKDRESYAVGVDLARNLKRRGVQLETEPLLQGVRDVISGQKLLLTEEDLRAALRTAQIKERQKLIIPQGGLAEQNAAKSAAFLAQNKISQGVVCLPSGLQYKVLKTGNGPKPTTNDTVECRFSGTLIDGTQFAGTELGGAPASLKVSQLVPGLKEALQLMPVGSEWKIFIPPQLGYGEQGAGRSRLGSRIGPNAALIYEVELLAIQ